MSGPSRIYVCFDAWSQPEQALCVFTKHLLWRLDESIALPALSIEDKKIDLLAKLNPHPENEGEYVAVFQKPIEAFAVARRAAIELNAEVFPDNLNEFRRVYASSLSEAEKKIKERAEQEEKKKREEEARRLKAAEEDRRRQEREERRLAEIAKLKAAAEVAAARRDAERARWAGDW